MLDAFDDDFVRPNPIHHVVQAFTAPAHRTLDPESWELVGHHPHLPAYFVGFGSVVAKRKYLGRRQCLVTRTEHAQRDFALTMAVRKVGRPFAALRRDNYPAAADSIFPEFSHDCPLFSTSIPHRAASGAVHSPRKGPQRVCLTGVS